MDLKKVPIADLHSEIARRENEARDLRIAEHEKRVRIVRENVDALLAVFQSHSRKSCSDDRADNATRDCVRCALIELKEYDVFPFVLSASLSPFNPNDPRFDPRFDPTVPHFNSDD